MAYNMSRIGDRNIQQKEHGTIATEVTRSSKHNSPHGSVKDRHSPLQHCKEYSTHCLAIIPIFTSKAMATEHNQCVEAVFGLQQEN